MFVLMETQTNGAVLFYTILQQCTYMICRYLVPLAMDAQGGTPPQYLYGYVPPNGVVILGLLHDLERGIHFRDVS